MVLKWGLERSQSQQKVTNVSNIPHKFLTMVLKEVQHIVLKAWMALLLADLSFLYSARGEVSCSRAASPAVSPVSVS